MRILIIDDNEFLLGTMAQWLSAHGHDVATASGEIQAADLFRQQPFTLVITDIVMPNGEELELVVRLQREHPDVRVIARSGASRHSGIYLSLANRLGAHVTLPKPFTPEELVEAIAKACAD